jgi:hypothetical protein
MARRPSRRVVVFAVLVGLMWGGWWWYGGNQRHIDDLLDTAYIYSEFPGEPDLNHYRYNRDGHDDSCPDGRGDWVGFKAARRADPTIGLQGAEPAATRFEAEGWRVERRLNTRDGGVPERMVDVSRGDDKISILYFVGAISISASSGPCNSVRDGQFLPNSDSYLVDRFDD